MHLCLLFLYLLTLQLTTSSHACYIILQITVFVNKLSFYDSQSTRIATSFDNVFSNTKFVIIVSLVVYIHDSFWIGMS